ncbi:unnamed protein product [Orchesella dallaii]|uniref:Glucose-methanol-choline oxidoreductase N-terminal domain-containing protein n=1 Tax=Orchesella dallaii TaxID=48710 RepID=A0ABP1PQ35_9HEXA
MKNVTFSVSFITRYAIPLVVATLFLGDVDVPQQVEIFDKTQRLTDETLSKGRGEGEGPPESFDYIIVGGGSAGALLANRLTASGENRVLLLEAGGDPNPIMDVPFAQRFYWNSVMDWNYTTVKQDRSCHLFGGNCIWPRGKALGGSSSVNGLVYNRCKPKDYDSWANFTGDQSWSWANVKETFNSIEDYHGFHEATAGSNHGYGGEMYVGTIDYLPGVEVIEEVLREKEIPIGDLNGGDEFTYGFSKIDYNIKDGMRCGTYQAFLEPILNRTNLVIYRYAYAIRVETISEGNRRRAIGITYERHGEIRTALVQKEVILSAGVVESPKILMLSGIGPKEHLDEINITTLVDLPVGKYLQEHPGMDVLGDTGGFTLNTTFGTNFNTTDNLLQFLENGTGPMNGFLYDSGDYAPQLMNGYLNSGLNSDQAWPDVYIYIHEKLTLNPVVREEMYFSLELVRVNSFGSIKLASNDHNDKPIIDPNFFEDLNDIERMVDVILIMMDVFMNSTTFQKYGIQ